jgi:hypothetical protein
MTHQSKIILKVIFVLIISVCISCSGIEQAESNLADSAVSQEEGILINQLVSGTYASSDVAGDLVGFYVAFEDTAGAAGMGAFALGDFNGDGYDDYAFSDASYNSSSSATPYHGRVYLVYGPFSVTDFASADVIFDAESYTTSSSSGDSFGTTLAAADLDADGSDELIIGAPLHPYSPGSDKYKGASYIIYGTTTNLSGTYDMAADLSISSTATLQGVQITGTDRYDRAGYVGSPGDVNGDGYEDLLIAASYEDTGASNAGAAYLIFGSSSFTSQFTADEHVASDIGPTSTIVGLTFAGENSGDKLHKVAPAGDVDADGYADFLVGSTYYDSNAGTAYLVYGVDIDLSTAATSYSFTDVTAGTTDFQGAQFYSATSSDEAASAIAAAGDLDADGYEDFAIGVKNDYDESSSSDRTGCVYVVSGSATRYTGSYELGSYSATSSNYVAKLVGDADSDEAGTSVAGVGDVNADGYDDLVVGAPYADATATNSGAAYLLYGPLTGLSELADVGVTVDGAVIEGSYSYGYLGAVVSGIGDFDTDGDSDFVITEPKTYSGSGTGYAYFIYGEPEEEEEEELFDGNRPLIDFNGDGAEDIVFRHDTNNYFRLVLVNGPVKVASSYPTDYTQATNYDFVGYGDFDGDAKTDILWREQTTGEFEIWFMDGLTVSSTATFADVRDTTYTVLQITDFNSDGITDILWEDSTTNLDVWLMSATAVSSTIDFGIPASGLTLKGSGDFNADGITDLLFLEESSGAMTISRLYSGTTIINTTFTPRLGGDFTIEGIRDFDGDGMADILTRRTFFTPLRPYSHGEIHVWFMNGASLSRIGFFGTLSMENDIAGIGDFAKDGTQDILFLNSVSKRFQIWNVNSSRSRTIHMIARITYPNPENWVAAKVADFDGDTDADILLWDPEAFLVFNWQYEGLARSSVGYSGGISMLTYCNTVE